jgi:hypothetical protein
VHCAFAFARKAHRRGCLHTEVQQDGLLDPRVHRPRIGRCIFSSDDGISGRGSNAKHAAIQCIHGSSHTRFDVRLLRREEAAIEKGALDEGLVLGMIKVGHRGTHYRRRWHDKRKKRLGGNQDTSFGSPKARNPKGGSDRWSDFVCWEEVCNLDLGIVERVRTMNGVLANAGRIQLSNRARVGFRWVGCAHGGAIV